MGHTSRSFSTRKTGQTGMDGASPCKSRSVGRSAWPAIIAIAIVAGCSTYIGTTSKSFIHQVRSNPDPNIRYLAYSKLGSLDLYDSPNEKSEAVKVLIAKLAEGKEPLAIRAVIIRSLGDLGDRIARDIVARSVSDPEAVIRTEACRALGKVGRPEDVTILAGVMAADNLEATSRCEVSTNFGSAMARMTGIAPEKRHAGQEPLGGRVGAAP